MIIVYGDGQTVRIEYDSEMADHVKRQAKVCELANFLLKSSGVIFLGGAFSATEVKYNLDSGSIDLRNQVGGVNNSFSDELTLQITQPIKEAIALIAKYEVLQRLPEGKNIRQLTQVDGLLKTLNPARRESIFGFSNRLTLSPIDQIISDAIVGKITCIQHVKERFDRLETKKPLSQNRKGLSS